MFIHFSLAFRALLFFGHHRKFSGRGEMIVHRKKRVWLISLIVLRASSCDIACARSQGTSLFQIYVRTCLWVFPYEYADMPHNQILTDVNFSVLCRRALPLAFVDLGSSLLFGCVDPQRAWLHLSNDFGWSRRVQASNVLWLATLA